jgi:hypothetical protein
VKEVKNVQGKAETVKASFTLAKVAGIDWDP